MKDKSPSEIENYRSLADDPASRKFETFSYLPEMDATSIRQQIQTMMDNGWNIAIEHVEPERSHRTYWYMWKLPMFGEWKLDTVIKEIKACRKANPEHHIKVIGYDRIKQSQGLAMVVSRAPETLCKENEN
jgi:ribulose-bisphosphate carboxylase small chain